MMNICNLEQFIAKLRAIQMHLESLYATHFEGFQKQRDKTDVEVIGNKLNSGYQEIIPLMNLITQFVKFRHQDNDSFRDFQVSFDSQLDGFCQF
jgi:hypothetical protein